MSLISLAFAAPAEADKFPRTTTDGRGIEVEISAPPQNVAALWTAAADMLVALGRDVGGVTTYEGARPVYLGDAVSSAIDLGDITAPNLEIIATGKFDLTIGLTRYNAQFASQIERFGPFLTYEGFNLAQSKDAIEKMGDALGAHDTAIAMNTRIDYLISEMSNAIARKERSFLFIWNFQDTLYGYKNNILTAELIAQIGAVNPLGFDDTAETPDAAIQVLETEDLLRLDPDVILMFVSHGGAVAFEPAYERLTSYQNNTIYSVGYQYTQPAGPIAREIVLREAAALIFPDIFEPPEMPEGAAATPVRFSR